MSTSQVLKSSAWIRVMPGGSLSCICPGVSGWSACAAPHGFECRVRPCAWEEEEATRGSWAVVRYLMQLLQFHVSLIYGATMEYSSSMV